MKIFTLIVFSLCFFGNIYSQKVVVIDELTKEPVSSAIISIENQNLISNDSGYVQFKVIKDKSVVVVSADGYLIEYISVEDLRKQGNQIYIKKNIFDLKEITVSANKWEQRLDEIPVNIVPVRVNDLDFVNPQTSADLLATNGHVYIQKSQLGGGSPMIRGFAANRVLIVVDGIRMNNPIYRSGNLQNIISVDPNSLEQAEIVLGPGSVIYGSDALGGVMDFHTTKPQFSEDKKKFLFKANLLGRYSSANSENTGHVNLNFGFKKIAFYTSYSYSKFGDLKMGTKHFDEYTQKEYVNTIYNIDMIIPNIDNNIQIYSAYNAKNILQSISWQLLQDLKIDYSFYFSTTSNVPRYDRLIQYKDNELKYAEWYYGPQKWQMHRLAIDNTAETALYDNLKINIAYQNYTESRHDRKFRKEEIRERTENVNVYSINIDAFKLFSDKTTLFYGLLGGYNTINSSAQLRNVISNTISNYAGRYPDGSTYQNYDVYTQLKTKISDRLIYNIGVRFSQVFIDALFDKTFYNFPFDGIHSTPNALTGSTGLVFSANNDVNFSFNISSGFRAPNIDDVGKVFDSEPGNVVVPNPDLGPENIYDIEIGFHKTSRKNYVNVTAFYSYLHHAMVRKDFIFNGQDSIMYDDEMSNVQALVNADYAIIYGIQADFGIQVLNNLVFKTVYSYINGRDSKYNSIRHVPPAYGASHLILNKKKIKFDLYANYNAEISNENLTPTEKDKEYMYASDENGNPYSPSWWTMNFKAQYKINKNVNVNAGIENIFDFRYRPYSSGIVAPGRNFIFSLKIKV